ncbi:Lrp/AsnC family transcriptional regulator [Natronoarchaeum sp. GCM10025703]|uniref:Lrp/AsnC family transcriptional regulator n=1 Tax=Natronoarchaeum sp. GCM10025703 TaxID=3252685 RepID=UPI00361708A1
MPLDDTDAEILRLLIEDASRSYREIGEEVDLTAPSVSDRVERLRELGVLERFTVAVDQSMFANSAARLVDVQVGPGEATGVAADLTPSTASSTSSGPRAGGSSHRHIWPKTNSGPS